MLIKEADINSAINFMQRLARRGRKGVNTLHGDKLQDLDPDGDKQRSRELGLPEDTYQRIEERIRKARRLQKQKLYPEGSY